MNSVPPLQYRLDHDAQLEVALAEDTPAVLIEMCSDFYDTRCKDAITSAADLLIMDTSEHLSIFKHTAFVNAGIMACAAFMLSDAPKLMQDRTLASLSMRFVPLSLLSDEPAGTLAAFEQLALKGHAQHPEFRNHTDMVMEYYTEVTQHADIGRMSFLGAGYGLHQLDNAWDRAREVSIDELYVAEVQEIDWDRILQIGD